MSTSLMSEKYKIPEISTATNQITLHTQNNNPMQTTENLNTMTKTKEVCTQKPK